MINYFLGHPIVNRCSYCGHDYDNPPRRCLSCGGSCYRLVLAVDRLTTHERETLVKFYNGGRVPFELPSSSSPKES